MYRDCHSRPDKPGLLRNDNGTHTETLHFIKNFLDLQAFYNYAFARILALSFTAGLYFTIMSVNLHIPADNIYYVRVRFAAYLLNRRLN